MTDTDPLILTLGFDEPSFRRFDTDRRRHFPSERNMIPAHLTLFHKLPADQLERIEGDLREVAGDTGAMRLSVSGLRFLGYGSAYVLRSPMLDRMRAELARRWIDWLTPQDAQRFQPHVTIQNKAPAAQAKALFAELEDAFEPFEVEGVSLRLWYYRGGPWEAAGEFPFRAAPGG